MVASVALMGILNVVRKAPEAYEDETGFHIVRERTRCSGASVLPRRSRTREMVGGRLHLPLPAGFGHFKG